MSAVERYAAFELIGWLKGNVRTLELLRDVLHPDYPLKERQDAYERVLELLKEVQS